jgi:hypothetical protein
MARGKKTGGRDFQPGVSGNPKGGPGLPKDLRDARKLNQQELERVVNKYLNQSLPALMLAMQDECLPMLDMVVANILVQAAQAGDHHRFDFILNRLVGKVQDRVEVTLPKPFVVNRLNGEQVVMGAELPPKEDEA